MEQAAKYREMADKLDGYQRRQLLGVSRKWKPRREMRSVSPNSAASGRCMGYADVPGQPTNALAGQGLHWPNADRPAASG